MGLKETRAGAEGADVPDAKHRAERVQPPFSQCRCICSARASRHFEGGSERQSRTEREARAEDRPGDAGRAGARRSEGGDGDGRKKSLSCEESVGMRAAHQTEVPTKEEQAGPDRDCLSLYFLWCPQCQELHRQIAEPERLEALAANEENEARTTRSGERGNGEAGGEAEGTDCEGNGDQKGRGARREEREAASCRFLRLGICARIEATDRQDCPSTLGTSLEALAKTEAQPSAALPFSHPVLTRKAIARAVARVLSDAPSRECRWAADARDEGPSEEQPTEKIHDGKETENPAASRPSGHAVSCRRRSAEATASREILARPSLRDPSESPAAPACPGRRGLSMKNLEEELMSLLGLCGDGGAGISGDRGCGAQGGSGVSEMQPMAGADARPELVAGRRERPGDGPFGVFLLPDALQPQEETEILAWADGGTEETQAREGDSRAEACGGEGEPRRETRAKEQGFWALSQSGRRKIDFGPKVNFKKKRLKLGLFNGFPPFTKRLLALHPDERSPASSCSRSGCSSPSSSPSSPPPPPLSSRSVRAFPFPVAASSVCTVERAGVQGAERLTLQAFRKKLLSTFQPVELCLLEYVPSRGSHIEEHFDDFWLWGPRLVTFTLASSTILSFVSPVFCVPRELFEAARPHSLCRHGEDTPSPSSYPSPSSSSAASPEALQASPASAPHSVCGRSAKKSASSVSSSASRESSLPSLSLGPSSLPSSSSLASECGRVRVEIRVLLPRRSLVVCEGPCRYTWTHAIRSHHIFSRRVAVTLRELAPEFLPGGESAEVGQKLLSLAASFNGSPVNVQQEDGPPSEKHASTETEETAWKRLPLVAA